MSTLSRRLAAATAGLAGLLLIGIAVLHLPSVRSRVFDRARGYAARELGITLHASDLTYNLFTRSMELRDLSVAASSSAEPFLAADRASVVFSAGIVLGRPGIDRITVSRPRLTVIRNADGTFNLPRSPMSSSSPQSPLRLGIVSATALAVRLDDRVAQRSLNLGPIDLAVDTRANAEPSDRFGPSRFTVHAGSIDLAGTLAGRLAFDGARVRVDELTIETSEGRVALTGWADAIGERPAIASRIAATIDLPGAARLASVDARALNGRLEATVDVSGPLAAPEIAVVLTTRDARYGPLDALQLSGHTTISESRVTIDRLDLDSRAGSLHVDGSVDLRERADLSAPSRLAVRWKDLRLDDLAQAFGPPLSIRPGARASGTATVDFDARDAAAWPHVSAVAASTLESEDSASAQAVPLSGTVDLRIDHGRWSWHHSLHASRLDAELEGDLRGVLAENGWRSTLSGRSHLRAANLGSFKPLMQSAAAQLPADALDELAGTASATVDVAGTTDSPRAEIELAVRHLRAKLMPEPASIDARLTADRDRLRAHHIHVAGEATSLQASGEYSWRGPFNARVEVNQRDLTEIVSRFHLPVMVAGTAHLEGTMTGARGRGQALLALSVNDLAIERVAIGPLTANATVNLADGSLTTVEATAPSVGARAQLEIVNRDGYPATGVVTVDNHAIGDLIPPAYRSQVGELAGNLSATVRASGQLADPGGIRGRVELRAVDLTTNGTRVVLAAPGSVDVSSDRIRVESLDVRVGEHTRLTADGQLGLAVVPDALRLHLEGPLTELIDIGSRRAGVPAPPVRSDGTAALDLTVGGTARHPLPNGIVAVRAGSTHYGTLAPVTGLALEATIDPVRIDLHSASGQWQGASFAARGAMPWRVLVAAIRPPPASGLAQWLSELPAEPSRAGVTLRASDVTPEVLKDILPAAQLAQIQGSASATVTVETPDLSLDRVEGTAVLDRAWLVVGGVPFDQDVPTRIRLQNGRASIDAFTWSAEGNTITVSGGAAVAASPPSLDLGVRGVLDLRALSAFVNGLISSGTADADLSVSGPFASPDVAGRVTLTDADLQLDAPRLAVADLKGTIRVEKDRHATVALSASVNTGSARLDGTIDLQDPASPAGTLQLTGTGVALEYPPGLQTESNIDLALALADGRSTLSGRIDVSAGSYREPLVLSTRLLNMSSGRNAATAAAPADDWLSRMRLDVAVATGSDVHIDNNYGRLDVGATVRLTGTAASPGVLGRVQAEEDGEIYLGGNTYRVERLAIDLTNPRQLTPDVSFAAQTRIGDLPIRIEFRCPSAAPCERKVTSLAPSVDDKEAEARLFGTAAAGSSAGESLGRLLSGELLGMVGRTVGLDAVRLEQGAARRDIFDDPTLISGDVNPAARLTLAKRIGSNVDVVFSQNLASDGFTWMTSYTGPYGLSGRLLLLDDQSRSYEFRHEPTFGAARRSTRPRPAAPRIASVSISGAAGFSEQALRKQLRLTEGDRFTFGEWQRDRDRLSRFYRQQGFLEARIRARRTAAASDEVQLEYTVTRGPATELVVTGATLTGAVRERILERWSSALFDGFLERDARTLVREQLYREGYLQAEVTAAVTADTSRSTKTLTIAVVAGSRVPSRLEVEGNAALTTDQLLDVVNAAGPAAPWLDPRGMELLLENQYRRQGFLDAHAAVSDPASVNGTSIVSVRIDEGRAYSIGQVELSGLPNVPDRDARDAFGFHGGETYRPDDIAAGINRLEGVLRQAAYLQANVDVQSTVKPETARVDLAVRVTAGRRSILRDVVVHGGDASNPKIARAIALAPNTPLDPDAIGRTRQRLYDLDVYRTVDIDVQPIEPTPAATPPEAPLDQAVVATIGLEERPRYRLRYGLAVSDTPVSADQRDQQVGFAADFESRNIFGRGATAGFSARLRPDQQVGRITLGAKNFFGLPIRSTIFTERKREQQNPEGAFPITSDVTDLSAEQAYRIRRSFEWRYGYGIERNRTFIRTDGADPFDLTVRIARFTTSGLVDRRDDVFNPSRGWFASSTLELSRPGLGSDLSFLKDFAQYISFTPLRHGIVLAAAARLGLARTFDDEVLIPSERFYAGGANTVRGYREDDLGARSILGDADGGSALVVVNGELRFPVYRWLKGVGFIDAGNVYPKVSDFAIRAFQIGLGTGARLDTPIGLIRFDLGIPVNPRSFDPRWRVHIGLGHAF